MITSRRDTMQTRTRARSKPYHARSQRGADFDISRVFYVLSDSSRDPNAERVKWGSAGQRGQFAGGVPPRCEPSSCPVTTDDGRPVGTSSVGLRRADSSRQQQAAAAPRLENSARVVRPAVHSRRERWPNGHRTLRAGLKGSSLRSDTRQ